MMAQRRVFGGNLWVIVVVVLVILALTGNLN